MKLETKLIWPGCAQGKYIVKAKGFILAILSWGREDKPLADWGPFAYVPVDPAGNGENEVEICMSSIESGVKFPRGYYRFVKGKKMSRNIIGE